MKDIAQKAQVDVEELYEQDGMIWHKLWDRPIAFPDGYIATPYRPENREKLLKALSDS